MEPIFKRFLGHTNLKTVSMRETYIALLGGTKFTTFEDVPRRFLCGVLGKAQNWYPGHFRDRTGSLMTYIRGIDSMPLSRTLTGCRDKFRLIIASITLYYTFAQLERTSNLTAKLDFLS